MNNNNHIFNNWLQKANKKDLITFRYYVNKVLKEVPTGLEKTRDMLIHELEKDLSSAISIHLFYQHDVETVFEASKIISKLQLDVKTLNSSQKKIEVLRIYDEIKPISKDIIKLSCEFTSNVFSQRQKSMVYSKACKILSEALSIHPMFFPVNLILSKIYRNILELIYTFTDKFADKIISGISINYAISIISKFAKLSGSETLYKIRNKHRTLYLKIIVENWTELKQLFLPWTNRPLITKPEIWTKRKTNKYTGLFLFEHNISNSSIISSKNLSINNITPTYILARTLNKIQQNKYIINVHALEKLLLNFEYFQKIIPDTIGQMSDNEIDIIKYNKTCRSIYTALKYLPFSFNFGVRASLSGRISPIGTFNPTESKIVRSLISQYASVALNDVGKKWLARCIAAATVGTNKFNSYSEMLNAYHTYKGNPKDPLSLLSYESSNTSNILVSIDATASVIQNSAMLSLDFRAMKYSNVIGSKTFKDPYNIIDIPDNFYKHIPEKNTYIFNILLLTLKKIKTNFLFNKCICLNNNNTINFYNSVFMAYFKFFNDMVYWKSSTTLNNKYIHQLILVYIEKQNSNLYDYIISLQIQSSNNKKLKWNQKKIYDQIKILNININPPINDNDKITEAIKNREVIKTTIMTSLYGSNTFEIAKRIKKIIKNIKSNDAIVACKFIIDQFDNKYSQIRKMYTFIQKSTKFFIGKGYPVKIKSSLVHLNHTYTKDKLINIEILLNDKKHRIKIKSPDIVPDIRKSVQAICANLTHACDAEIVAYVINKANYPIYPIYDSFMISPNNVDETIKFYAEACHDITFRGLFDFYIIDESKLSENKVLFKEYKLLKSKYEIRKEVNKDMLNKRLLNAKFGLRPYSTNKVKQDILKYIQPLKIRLNKKGQEIKPHMEFITADFETIVINDTHYVIAAAYFFKDTHSVIHIDTHNLNENNINIESNNVILRFLEIVNSIKTKKKKKKIYFHNLSSFDGVFILNTINTIPDIKTKNINPIIRGGKIYQIIYNNLIFKDSLLLLSSGLKKLSIDFNCKPKGDFDFKKLKIKKLNKLREEITIYILNDVQTLYEILTIFWKTIQVNFNIDFTNSMTIASLAFNIYRKKYLKFNDKIYKSTYNINHYNFLNESYRGGISELYIPQGNDLFYYDINSSYPCSMTKDMPCGSPSIEKNFNNNDISNFFGFLHVKINVPDYDINNKNTWIPLIGIKKKGVTIYPSGTFTTVLFSEELKEALKYGTKIIQIHHALKFQRNNMLFKEYVHDLFKLKSSNTISKSEKYIYKLLLNSLYGRFGMSKSLNRTILIKNKDFPLINSVYSTTSHTSVEKSDNTFITISGDGIDNFDNLLISDHKDIDTDILKQVSDAYNRSSPHLYKLNIATQISSAISAYSRIKIHQIKMKILKLNGKIYYSDTDSIITDIKLNTSNKLGDLKLEDTIKTGFFPSQKVYAYINSNNNIIKKFKGIPENLRESLNIDDFKNFIKNETEFKPEKWIKSINKDLNSLRIISTNASYSTFFKLTKRDKIFDSNNKWIDTKPIKYIEILDAESITPNILWLTISSMYNLYVKINPYNIKITQIIKKITFYSLKDPQLHILLKNITNNDIYINIKASITINIGENIDDEVKYIQINTPSVQLKYIAENIHNTLNSLYEKYNENYIQNSFNIILYKTIFTNNNDYCHAITTLYSLSKTDKFIVVNNILLLNYNISFKLILNEFKFLFKI